MRPAGDSGISSSVFRCSGRLLHARGTIRGLAALGALLRVGHPPLDASRSVFRILSSFCLMSSSTRRDRSGRVLLALPPQPVEQILKPGEVGPAGFFAPRWKRGAERAPRIAVRQEVVGHRVEELMASRS